MWRGVKPRNPLEFKKPSAKQLSAVCALQSIHIHKCKNNPCLQYLYEFWPSMLKASSRTRETRSSTITEIEVVCRHHIRWWCAWVCQEVWMGRGGNLAEFMFLAVNRPETLGWTFKCIGHPQTKSWLPKLGASNLFLQGLQIKVSYYYRKIIGLSKITSRMPGGVSSCGHE